MHISISIRIMNNYCRTPPLDFVLLNLYTVLNIRIVRRIMYSLHLRITHISVQS